jgi:glyoxylase-like metal-dependent hydrolase (beta-lactamase superfamily II)/rhodanese-related sulfurtransferase
MLVFRQLFDPVSSTYTYLLADRDSGEALLIDPVFEQVRRDAALLAELGLRLLVTIDTHVHADHVTGAWLLRERLGSGIALAAKGGASGATRHLQHGERIVFGSRWLEARATPGHTDGCMSFVLDDRSMAFTGDCLLIRGSGRTDFQQGDPQLMFSSVHGQLFSLPDDCLLYPGHDYRGLTVSSVAEEKRYNPRLGAGISEADFAGYMANLHLPHPRQLAVAVPANLRCGQPEAGTRPDNPQDWAQINFSFAGIWEIMPQALEELSLDIQVLDVREPEEFHGALGHIEGAISMPIGTLQSRSAELDAARPVVCVCRSGARSAQAVVLLQKAGFMRVANLAGGMLRWRAEGHRVTGGSN